MSSSDLVDEPSTAQSSSQATEPCCLQAGVVTFTFVAQGTVQSLTARALLRIYRATPHAAHPSEPKQNRPEGVRHNRSEPTRGGCSGQQRRNTSLRHEAPWPLQHATCPLDARPLGLFPAVSRERRDRENSDFKLLKKKLSWLLFTPFQLL